jgi:hypothetical protein
VRRDGALLRLGGRGGRLDEGRLRLRLGRGRLLGLLGLLDRGALEALGIGETADAVRRGVVDARRVALDAELELLGELEHDGVLDAQLSRQLVDADLFGGQSGVLPYLPADPAPALLISHSCE